VRAGGCAARGPVCEPSAPATSIFVEADRSMGLAYLLFVDKSSLVRLLPASELSTVHW